MSLRELSDDAIDELMKRDALYIEITSSEELHLLLGTFKRKIDLLEQMVLLLSNERLQHR